MRRRIPRSRATGKALHSRLQDAYERDEGRLVRRPTVLIDLLVPHVPVAVLGERWGLSPSVGTVRPNGGWSFHQARLVSDHREAGRRHAWLQEAWPTIGRAATRRHGLRRCKDAASGAPWGAVRDPWARRGQQPEVPTSGTRKGSKGCGAIASCSGRLGSQGMEGRGTSASSQGFVPRIRAPTSPHLLLVHDGARDHPRKAPQPLCADHADRLPGHPRPSYSPDDHPMKSLWKKTPQRATPHQYCKEFGELTGSGDSALASVATHPETV